VSAASLKYTVHTLLSLLKRKIKQLLRVMHENAVLFSLGPRPPTSEEGASLLHEEVAPQDDAAMADTMPPPSSSSPSLDEQYDSRDLPNPDKEWDPHSELFAFSSLAHVSQSSAPLTDAGYHYPRATTPTSYNLGNTWADTNAHDREEAGLVADSCNEMGSIYDTRGAADDVEVKRCLENMPQPEYGQPFLTLTPSECDEMDALLAPVHDSLLKLKGTTLESLPEYKVMVKARNHAQVLKARLSTIATHIQHVLHDVPEQARGATELKIW
jgi:hypothetical protein